MNCIAIVTVRQPVSPLFNELPCVGTFVIVVTGPSVSEVNFSHGHTNKHIPERSREQQSGNDKCNVLRSASEQELGFIWNSVYLFK